MVLHLEGAIEAAFHLCRTTKIDLGHRIAEQFQHRVPPPRNKIAGTPERTWLADIINATVIPAHPRPDGSGMELPSPSVSLPESGGGSMSRT